MLTAEQTAAIALARSEIALAKHVVYDGFEAALAAGVPKDKAGILVDEQFGAAILGEAAAQGYVTACPAEKSGQILSQVRVGSRTSTPAFRKAGRTA
jgi:5-dehydro-2-deoxygluconokinase